MGFGDRFKVELECPLNDEEILERGRELATKLGERDHLEQQPADTAKRFKRLIGEATNRIDDLRFAINSGAEMREVECYEMLEPVGRRDILTIRTDTGERVRSRPAKDTELNLDLFPE